MDRYTTIMIIPEHEKGIRSFRVPLPFFRSLAFLVVVVTILIGVLGYDYWQILQQVYENKHLSIENRQLKEQIQLFQMKINSLSNDISRIHIFEKKLRIITGIEDFPSSNIPKDIQPEETGIGPTTDDTTQNQSVKLQTFDRDNLNQKLSIKFDTENITKNPDYKQLKNLYDKKIAEEFGLQSGYQFTKNWSELTQRSFSLAEEYAKFDFQYNKIKQVAKKLEIDIHEIDQNLLDKDSFLKSTPSILPCEGWITSYFGGRFSPYSGRLKMHEGLDIGAPTGTNIVSPADGIVTYSGLKTGFGIYVQVDHGYGVETIYGHNKANFVRNGQKVKRGDTIAQLGNTGLSTGPHLHYEVRVNGNPVDPMYFILN